MLEIILGIDPGKTGAYALVSTDGILIQTGNLHTPKPGGKNWCYGLLEAVKEFKDSIVQAVVEEGSTRPQNAKWSTYKTGRGVGQITGLLQGRGIRYRTVPAEAWKPGLGLTGGATYKDRKRIAVAYAKTVWPGMKFRRHDHAEAALLALWYIRQVRIFDLDPAERDQRWRLY